MVNAALRQQLHHFIDVVDDKKIEAIYDLFKKDIGTEKYTASELAEFYSRLEKYKKGEMPGFTMEEAHNYIRQHKKG